MPTRLLARAELARLGAFPEAIDRDDLAEHFRLSGDDLELVRAQRGAASQLGIALQLCALRWLGFIPEDLAAAPAAAVESLAVALDVPARAVFDYAVRAPTRREHRLAVRAHAGWRAFGDPEAAEFRAWLAELALEHDRPAFLFTRACEELRGRRIERPAIDRLTRLVAWARERAHERTFELLAAQLTEPVCAALDALLQPDASSKRARTPLSWLRSRPTTVSAGALRGELQKREYLIERVGADRLDLSGLPPNRQALLAQQGRRSTSQALGRLEAQRRYPALACFCSETLERVTDDAVEVFDRALGSADRRAQRKRDELRRRHSRDTQSTLKRFIDVTRLLLEARESNTDVLGLIDRRIGLERLSQDLQLAERIVRPTADTHLDLLIADDDHSRKLLGELNAALTFHRTGDDDDDDDELLAALRLIAELAGSSRRWLPGFSPSAFIDGRWRPLVADVSRGRLDRRGYELCAAFELRTALRAGRVWVEGSRRHADPASYLLPEEKWRPVRAEFAARVRQPLQASERLDQLAGEQAELVKRLDAALDAEASAQLNEGELVVEEATDKDPAGKLGKLVAERLPEIGLPELLIEVDGWTGFTQHLTPAGTAASRGAELPCVLYAAILAQATNLGLTGMARGSRFSYEQLDWATDWYLREATLYPANACLVDYHHALALAGAVGSGRLSSSDGVRLASRTRGPETAALPRYFGHRRRGIQHYSWTSDQYSQYDSRVIGANVRDATYTLDGILDNQTALEIEEHTTDTHGYTEMIFAAYDLLGRRFCPRIRDLDRQRLYQHGPSCSCEAAERLRHRLRPELIVAQWDSLLRLAASLEHGWAPASLLLSRLQASDRRNPLALALQEYGRLIKTNFILAWLADEQLQRRYGRQLNKGEAMQGLRRVLFYAYQGQSRHRSPDQQAEQALCLTLVVNAIVVWNTVYAQLAIDQLRADGQAITSTDLAGIGLYEHAHLHAYGDYPFDETARPTEYRSLRQPATATRDAIAANRV